MKARARTQICLLLFLSVFESALEPKADSPAPKPRQNAEQQTHQTAGEPRPPKDDRLAEIRKLLEAGKYKDAESQARSLLAETQAKSGTDSLEAARVIDQLVLALSWGGKAREEETKELAERAVALKEKSVGARDSETAESLDGLASVLYRRGDYPPARRIRERALEIFRETLGPEHRKVVVLLNNLAIVCNAMGDYQASKSYYEQGITAAEKGLGPEDRVVALLFGNFGNVLDQLGEFAEAQRALERSLKIYEKLLPANHLALATVNHNLGSVLYKKGDYTGARQFWERALAIWEEQPGPGHRDTMGLLSNLGAFHQRIGNYEDAQRLLERALALGEKLLGPEHPDLGYPLHNLGLLSRQRGNLKEAEKFLLRAATIRERKLGTENPMYATTLTELGALYREAGNLPKARAYLERALAITEKARGSTEGYYLFDDLTELGMVLVALGEGAAGRDHLERAVAIVEQFGGLDHPRLTLPLNGLVEFHAKNGEIETATQVALRAERISREHLQLTVGVLPEREALAYMAGRQSGLHSAISLNTEGNTSAAKRIELWDAVIRSRAVVLDEMGARNRRARAANDPEVQELMRDFVQARQYLARIAIRGPEKDVAIYHKELERARQEKVATERALAEKSSEFRRDELGRRIGFSEVAGALPPRTALVGFFKYRQSDWKAPTGTQSAEPVPSYVAFVLRSGQREPALLPLGPATRVDNVVAELRDRIAREGQAAGRSTRKDEVAFRESATAARRIIWDPLVPHLGKVEQVFIVPDGALNLLNFAALPIGQVKYLIETGPRIHYLSAERDIVLLPMRELTGEGILAVGAPAFDEKTLFAAYAPQEAKTVEKESGAAVSARTFRGERSACGDFRFLRFDPLPATARESEQVLTLWKRSGAQKAPLRGVLPTVSYLKGAAASEAAFKQQAPGKRILHLATHGFFLGGKCASELNAAEKPDGNAAALLEGENPLLLSGLALAGANHRQAAGGNEEDGILTAEEIASLDLSGTEWAVLSACDTGIGQVQVGEGVLGLRRAFQVAGARTLIMSLWPVEDMSAQTWMRELYRGRLERNLTTVDAVHEASLRTLRQRRAKGQSTHPFYWAAFVAAGDWR